MKRTEGAVRQKASLKTATHTYRLHGLLLLPSALASSGSHRDRRTNNAIVSVCYQSHSLDGSALLTGQLETARTAGLGGYLTFPIDRERQRDLPDRPRMAGEPQRTAGGGMGQTRQERAIRNPLWTHCVRPEGLRLGEMPGM
jgi:hypothetical protein